MKTTQVTVSRGTFNVRYGGDPEGFPVVMLHGWPESSYCWEAVAEFLLPSLQMVAPDLRGLGDSERTLDVKAYQKLELAKDMLATIDELGVDEFFLVGHDWGGIVAQELTLLIPARVKKLVLMSIPVITNTEGEKETEAALTAKRFLPLWYQYFQLQPGLAEAMIRGNEHVWLPYFFGKKGKDGSIPRHAIDEYVRCYSIENTPATAASYYRTRRLDATHWATLAGRKFQAPTLYVYGEEEIVIVKEFLNHLEHCFDSIRIETLKAEHFVHEEKPREVAALMNDFLETG